NKDVPSVAPESKTCIASSSLSHPSLPRPAPSLDRSLPPYDRPKTILSQTPHIKHRKLNLPGHPPCSASGSYPNNEDVFWNCPRSQCLLSLHPTHSPLPTPPGRIGSLTPHTASSLNVPSRSISPVCLKMSPHTPLPSPPPLEAGIGTII
ncbi:conserved hypothetical protein, partial [Ixodes scapularis]